MMYFKRKWKFEDYTQKFNIRFMYPPLIRNTKTPKTLIKKSDKTMEEESLTILKELLPQNNLIASITNSKRNQCKILNYLRMCRNEEKITYGNHC